MNHSISTLVALAVLVHPARSTSHDGEWPPKADPHFNGSIVVNNPVQGSPESGHLFMHEVSAELPTVLGKWLTHKHEFPPSVSCQQRYPGFFTDFSVGNVDDDGKLDDIVITIAGEAVLAAEMYFNGTDLSLTPIWFWKSPFAEQITTDVDGAPLHFASGNVVVSCKALEASNPLIWDFAGDSRNEVVFAGLSANDEQQLFVLRTDDPAVRWDDQLTDAQNLANMLGNVVEVGASATLGPIDVSPRLGICRVRDTLIPQDIVSSTHNGAWYVWGVGSSGQPFLQFTGPTSNGISEYTHEVNWMDIDGDGFDEFAMNGLVDYVDLDAQGNRVVLTNPAIWQADVTLGNGHCDETYIADWDPTRPGLELFAVTEGLWSLGRPDAATLQQDFKAWDVLFDADTGEVLSEWTQAPSPDGQTIYGGNWTRSHDGLEAIMSPKDSIGDVSPPDQVFAGSYVSVARRTPTYATPDFELLTIDGAQYRPVSGLPPPGETDILPLRAGGPWRRMFALDWDGDYGSDEILHHSPFNNGPVTVYRLGEKGDWAMGSMPEGLPTYEEVVCLGQTSGSPCCTQFFNPACIGPIVDATQPDDPNCSSTGWWWFYSQGACGTRRGDGDWGWNHGGPGRGTHYFQKLKEHFPNDGLSGPFPGNQGALVAKPFDLLDPDHPFAVGADHREEVIAISKNHPPKVHLYFHNDTLPSDVLDRPSPTKSSAYLRHRQTRPTHPFQFQRDAIAIERFAVRPADPTLPTKAAGVATSSDCVTPNTMQLLAYIEFSDGTMVYPSVTWNDDEDLLTGCDHMSIDGTGLVTIGTAVESGRFTATMTIEGEERQSDPFYVYASDSDDPAILRAGFADSWIVSNSNVDRPLRIEALVALRTNGTVEVRAQKPNGSAWDNIQLRDDGLGPDEEANDGLFTAAVAQPNGLSAASDDDNLRVLRAMTPPVIYYSLGNGVWVPHGAEVSKPWPFVDVAATSVLPPWGGAVTDTPGGVPNQTKSYKAPRVRSMGYRGWDIDGEYLLEVELEPSPLRPTGTTKLYVDASPVGLGGAELMTHRGGDIYTLKLPVDESNPNHVGLKLLYVAAVNGTYKSDTYPKIRVHPYPSWAADEPAPALGFDLELVGW